MRFGWSILFVLLAGAVLPASVPPGEPVVTPAIREESRQYAEFMSRFLGEVHRQYVRRVDHIDLIEAAVQGLYEAARQPLPEHLRDEIRRSDRETYLAKLRAQLGDSDAVRGTRSIMASINA